jgi:hypothetical protein
MASVRLPGTRPWKLFVASFAFHRDSVLEEGVVLLTMLTVASGRLNPFQGYDCVFAAVSDKYA